MLSNFVFMLADLKLNEAYDGLIFLAEAQRNLPFIRSHRHVELEANLVVQGSITYVVSGRRHTFYRGALLWIFSSHEHQLVDRSADAQYYVAVFKPRLIKQACRGDRYVELKSEHRDGPGILSCRLKVESFDFVLKTMATLMAGTIDPDILNQEAGYGVGSDFRYQHSDPDALNAGLHYLLILGWRFAQEGLRSGEAVDLHPSVQKALVLLGNDESEEGLGRVAALCGVSMTYLSRLFRRQVGVPLVRYRNSVRLSRFMAHRAQPGQKTIAESVYAAGFGSYAQFYKVFVESYGRGPSRYLNVD